MSRIVTSLASLVLIASAAIAADPQPKTELTSKISIPANAGFATNVSPDGQVATIIFDDMVVDLSPATQTGGGVHGQTAISTKLVTINFPYTTEMRSVKMRADIRGFVSTDGQSTARLVACLGDVTKSVALSDKSSSKLKGKSKQAVAAKHSKATFGDFMDQVEFVVQTHAKKPVLQATLLLCVEHDTDVADGGSAVLAVDSIDLSIVGGGGAYSK